MAEGLESRPRCRRSLERETLGCGDETECDGSERKHLEEKERKERKAGGGQYGLMEDETEEEEECRRLDRCLLDDCWERRRRRHTGRGSLPFQRVLTMVLDDDRS